MKKADQVADLSAPIESLEGIGPSRAKLFRELEVRTFGDLLNYFPRSYQRYAAETSIDQLKIGQINTTRGEVVAVDYVRGSGRARFEATLKDGAGTLALVWFNGNYLRNLIRPGITIRVQGKTGVFRNISQMVNPKWKTVTEETDAIQDRDEYRPVYPASVKLPSRIIAATIQDNLPEGLPLIEEWFEAKLLRKRDLLGRRQAYQLIHQPKREIDAARARRRLIYDELMLMQIGLQLSRRLRTGRISAPTMRVDKLLDERIRARFPFAMTSAQERAVWDILRDLQKNEPMNRLLQGDVGSGKTIVALYSMLVAVANKMQAAILAPTEVLAEQHYLTISRLLKDSQVTTELLTQRTKKLSKGSIVKAVANGKVHLAVGTQALIQDDVEFANLGLVVVDEQHRLGVRQRATLKQLAHAPHYLVMTATPIPRTLALSYFADFDVSVLDELPPGRKAIETRWLPRQQASQGYQFIRRQVELGRQAYIVVPQIDGESLDEVTSVKTHFETLSKGPLNGMPMAMLHGQMSTEEKQLAMTDFRERKTHVLVATTVIEVGIDVPNATVMLIEDADRFGLSQLHQLRGRVGRGEHRSFCILVSDAATESARKRIDVMTETSDGFLIAERDLEMRGPGEFFGTRQHGMPEMQLADISKEVELLGVAKEDAIEILQADPNLDFPQNLPLRKAIAKQFGKDIGLANVG